MPKAQRYKRQFNSAITTFTVIHTPVSYTHLWGREKGIAEYLQSVEAQRALQMTLVATVAEAYFELIALDNDCLLYTSRECACVDQMFIIGGIL